MLCLGHTGATGSGGVKGVRGDVGNTGATGATGVQVHDVKRRVVRQVAGCPGIEYPSLDKCNPVTKYNL